MRKNYEFYSHPATLLQYAEFALDERLLVADSMALNKIYRRPLYNLEHLMRVRKKTAKLCAAKLIWC